MFKFTHEKQLISGFASCLGAAHNFVICSWEKGKKKKGGGKKKKKEEENMKSKEGRSLAAAQSHLL